MCSLEWEGWTALRFGLVKRFARARQDWRKMMKVNSAFGSDALRLPAWLWGGAMGSFCQCEWGSGSVADPVVLRVERPRTGVPDGSPGWAGWMDLQSKQPWWVPGWWVPLRQRPLRCHSCTVTRDRWVPRIWVAKDQGMRARMKWNFILLLLS